MKFSLLLVTFALFANVKGLTKEEDVGEIPTIIDGSSGIVQDDNKAQNIALENNVINAEDDSLPVLEDRGRRGNIENTIYLLKWELVLCR